MIWVRKAKLRDVDGICRVCAEGWRDTYPELLPQRVIEEVVARSYNPERIRAEVLLPSGWNGWWVAEEDRVVVGAGGGGLVEPGTGEIYILYVDPRRRGEGIGSLLLQAITQELKEMGAQELWVSVAKGNRKGIPFYRARGFAEKGERPANGIPPEENLVVLRFWRPIE